jgi:hypothetical protein
MSITTTKTYVTLNLAFGEETISRTQIFESLSKLISGITC